jgi:peptidoglycan/xylan/chitin deacetylase (PgdA/CDA1 family)
MKKIVSGILILILLTGCGKNVNSYINEKKHISVNYPVTNIGPLDDAVSSYVNRVYTTFKNSKEKKHELNISYTYKEVNNDVINVTLKSEIVTDKTINKIKTFTYNRKSNKFLTMEDLVEDLNGLDYEIKKALLDKYQDADMNYLNDVSYNYFSIGDDNLTLYFNPTELKSKTGELVYLDIPLNSLKLLIDIDKTKGNDTYLKIKKKNVSIDDKVVALTFDDGPSRYTDKILDILKRHEACATFFLIGNKVDFYGDTLQRMLKEGSEIGNHSYDHKLLTRVSENEFKDEINKTNDAIKKVTGFTPALFRPTYGGYSNALKSYTNLKFVLWNVDSRDWQVRNTEGILRNVVPNVRSGSIVLMHDNHEYAVNALDEVIEQLQKENYKFITVSELLELKSLREE